jgi:hypothetical protein
MNLARSNIFDNIRKERVRITNKSASCFAPSQNVEERATLHIIFTFTHKLAILTVEKNNAPDRIIHAKSVRHVVECSPKLSLLFASIRFRSFPRLQELLTLRDVLVGCYPAAFSEGLADDADHPAIFAGPDKGIYLSVGKACFNPIAGFVNVAKKRADLFAMREKVAERKSWFHYIGRDAVQFEIARVAQHEPVRSIEHHQAL